MNLVANILSFFKKNKSFNPDESPKGLCPNCWGRQEYGGKFYEAIKNYDADINTDNPYKGWVQEYADKHLTGIYLHAVKDRFECPNCKIYYKPIKE